MKNEVLELKSVEQALPTKSLAVQPIAAPVREQVVATLRHAILTGHFEPGERLVEAQLCELLNVSRASIREALRQLEAEKLITVTPFKGPSVRRMTVKEAEHLYEVRSLLEAQAAAICAKNATEDSIQRMRDALKRFETAVKNKDAIARLESTDEFYEVILKTWGNELVFDILSGLQSRINFLRIKSMSMPDRAEISLKEMTAILDGIVSRKPSKASAAARDHVNQAFQNAKLMLE